MKIFIKPLKSQDLNKNNQFTLEILGSKLSEITNSLTSVITLKERIIKSIVDISPDSSNDYKKHYNDVFLTYLDDEKNVNKIETNDDLEVAILLNQTANNSIDLSITAEVNFENFPNHVVNRIKNIFNEENNDSNKQEEIKSRPNEENSNSNSQNIMNGFSVEEILNKKKQMKEKMDLERCIRQMKKKKEGELQESTPGLSTSNTFKAVDKKSKYVETLISNNSETVVKKDEVSHNTSINFNDYFNSDNNKKSVFQHHMLEYQIREAIMREIDSRKENLAETILKGLRDVNVSSFKENQSTTFPNNRESNVYDITAINTKILPSKEFSCSVCRMNFKNNCKIYFSCLFCNNYDLCFKCENFTGKSHGHPLIKHNVIDIKENLKNKIKNNISNFYQALVKKENEDLDVDVDGNENLLKKNGTLVVEGNNFINSDNQKSVNFGKHDKDQMEESVIIMENFINQK
jgi:hypothetical protein